ncbi:hypothetical protein [Nostoc sp. NZL]|uniref:hypothetical protein n=1 Tax=Nostoc sp. NZL TaxID=2650612 RepID=UPI0018C51680|nr:hypothetical protein [Nostoc sp. NZL]
MTVNRQQSTVNDHQECLYTLDAHQLTIQYVWVKAQLFVKQSQFFNEPQRAHRHEVASRSRSVSEGEG